jgi:hypothetical protein
MASSIDNVSPASTKVWMEPSEKCRVGKAKWDLCVERDLHMTPESNRTLDQVYRSAVNGLYSRIKSNYEFLYRKFGDEGIRLIEEMSREYGLAVGQRAKSRLASTDLDSVAGYLLRIFDTVSHGSGLISIVEQSKQKCVIKVDKCPLDFTIPAMCLAHTAMEKTVVQALNPGLAYRIGKSIPAGDTCCEHIIEALK